ncbi:hypothetical protein SY88_16375 [Clostridiales bacterium PH28_bin88]|nr:hypothetical protein SY88_16375 [Clostridiales bacterium PH28_bin88]
MSVNALDKRIGKSRTERLRERLFTVPLEISVDRFRLVTESYQETEGQPMIIRRAKALKKILEEMPITIFDDELIVGSFAKTSRGGPLFPELAAEWLLSDIDNFEKRTQDKFLISEESKQVIKELVPYWKGKTVWDRVVAQLPPETEAVREEKAQVFYPSLHMVSGFGHTNADYEMAMRKGFSRITDELKEKLNALDLTKPENLRKRLFYEAVIIVLEAGIVFAKRMAALARRLAEQEKNPVRKEELLKIAEINEWVPANPARTFHEALQTFWYVHLIMRLETNGLSHAPGRFDQYMYPYYKQDIEKGILSKEEAQELVDSTFIKLTEILNVFDTPTSHYHAGFPETQNMVVGGQTVDGRDATNDLTFICLEAMKNARTPQPNFGLRVHERTPDEVLMKAIEVIKVARQPQLFNDQVHIPAVLSQGANLEEARDYVCIGCVEPQVAKKAWGITNSSWFNMAKALELALNDGKDRMTGKQVGPHTGDPRKFSSLEEVMGAYRKQIEYFVKHMVIAVNTICEVHAELVPLPFTSVFHHDCLEEGKDVTWGGAKYNYAGVNGVGTANVGDSLAAIKKLVFEDQVITMAELMDVLDSNFEGKEDLRQMLLNRAPKLGSGDEYVDALTREALAIYDKEVKKYSTNRGGMFKPGHLSTSTNVPFGEVTGALPDGRKAGRPLADGVSPSHGSDKNGPTAVATSVARAVDAVLGCNGPLLNMKFSPSAVHDERGIRNLMGLIRTYFDLGGAHIQFNIVSRETLEKAQANPEEYKDLMVRVAGYSVFFTEINRDMQNDIIDRTEYSFTS